MGAVGGGREGRKNGGREEGGTEVIGGRKSFIGYTCTYTCIPVLHCNGQITIFVFDSLVCRQRLNSSHANKRKWLENTGREGRQREEDRGRDRGKIQVHVDGIRKDGEGGNRGRE